MPEPAEWRILFLKTSLKKGTQKKIPNALMSIWNNGRNDIAAAIVINMQEEFWDKKRNFKTVFIA
jgi:hypothetical protein